MTSSNPEDVGKEGRQKGRLRDQAGLSCEARNRVSHWEMHKLSPTLLRFQLKTRSGLLLID